MEAYKDKSFPISKRIDDLLSRLTLEEKAGFISYMNDGVPRLGIPPYSWWNEALHGVARSGCATVFPQAIAMAATFSPELVEKMGEVIAIEGRARNRQAAEHNDHGTYKGLTYWSPNVNIFRDPRWGRGQETYGECPYLTGLLGAAFVHGVQGHDPEHLKASACAKHFAAHSGPEDGRMGFDSKVSEKDLRETYLRAFKACVDAGVSSIMTAYNALNGTPCCINRHLLEDILRAEWGFRGAVVTDVGCSRGLVDNHKKVSNYAEGLEKELQSGVDVISDFHGQDRCKAAWAERQIAEKTLDTMLRHQLDVKFRLGMFDDDCNAPSPEVIECKEHRQLALECARRSVVLLKNDQHVLPLDKRALKTIAVIGPTADNYETLIANYSGTPTRHVTILQGVLNEADDDCRIIYALGSELIHKISESCAEDYDTISEAVSCAERADAVILCVGLTHRIEGEGGNASNPQAAGDKADLELPAVQRYLYDAVRKVAKRLILVNVSGSALHLPDADTILQVFYPGAEGGTAVADILFGNVNPSGKLPVTFYNSAEDLPPFTDYAMDGRTYRFYGGAVQFPFGYGLSYTTFAASNLHAVPQVKAGEPLTVEIDWTNMGKRAGEDVVQIYVHAVSPSPRAPLKQLAAVKRVSLQPSETKHLVMTLDAETFQLYGDDGKTFYETGKWRIMVNDLSCDVMLNS